MSGFSWRVLVPDSIAARMTIAMVLGLLLTQVVSAMVYLSDRGEERPLHSIGELVKRMASAVQLVESSQPSERQRIVGALDDPMLGVALHQGRPDFDPEHIAAPLFLQHLAEALGGTGREILAEKIRVPSLTPVIGPLDNSNLHRVRVLRVGVALSDGTWLVFSASHSPDGVFRPWRFSLWMALTILVVAGVSLWTARRMSAPLAAFTIAAENLVVNATAQPLPETGPRELRAATHAINQMQQRLSLFVEDRTRMIAAISHDLRTPLTRLRLRAEFIEDPETQAKVLADIAEMEAMTSATLAFARDDAQHEPRERVDLADMLHSLVDDRTDMGLDAHFLGTWRLVVACSPVAIRRALANLIDNAINYGGKAVVSLRTDDGLAVIEICDAGPGIAEAERENVFRPFYRLETSRSRDTGGTGLGLSVARSIISGHGGAISLTNLDEGGLKVTVTLPLQARQKVL